MGAGGVKEDAPASVGREAKGLLRRQGSKSPSCLIGSIIAFLKWHTNISADEIKLHTRYTKKSAKCFTFLCLWVLICSDNLICGLGRDIKK